MLNLINYLGNATEIKMIYHLIFVRVVIINKQASNIQCWSKGAEK